MFKAEYNRRLEKYNEFQKSSCEYDRMLRQAESIIRMTAKAYPSGEVNFYKKIGIIPQGSDKKEWILESNLRYLANFADSMGWTVELSFKQAPQKPEQPEFPPKTLADLPVKHAYGEPNNVYVLFSEGHAFLNPLVKKIRLLIDFKNRTITLKGFKGRPKTYTEDTLHDLDALLRFGLKGLYDLDGYEQAKELLTKELETINKNIERLKGIQNEQE